jgi:hypothetical protein
MRKLCQFGHPYFIPVLGDGIGIAKSAWKIRGTSVASKLTFAILILANVQQIFLGNGQSQCRVQFPDHRCDWRKVRDQWWRREGRGHDLDGARKSDNDSERHAKVVGERRLNSAITRAKQEVILHRAQLANRILRSELNFPGC